jgi:uncharacterized protein YdbL (DUF1318 family)
MPSSDALPLARRAVLGLLAGACLLPLLPGLAFAQTLDEARAQGILGERPDGYLGVVNGSAPAWAVTLMEDVNAQRRVKYEELAAANGTSVEAVQVVAAEKIIAKLPAGAWYMDAGGAWVQK